MAVRPWSILAGVLALGVLAACATGSKAPRGTVTVTVPPPSPASTAAAASASTTSSAPSSPAAPTHLAHLGGTCDSLLTLADVENALGRSVKGKTAFVQGLAERDIGRLSYLNCRYGLASATAAPGLELGISLYTTPAKASARITATVDDYENHGATATPVTVSGVAGTLLVGGTGSDYSVPTLVLASGQRTVAVSATAAVAPTAERSKDLAAVAALALTRTGG